MRATLAVFIVKRLGLLLIQVWAIVTIVFILVQLLPGNPAYLLAGPLATKAQLAELTRQLGLDQPLYVRYIDYIGGLLHGNLGQSFTTHGPVIDDLIQRFPATLELVTAAFILIVVVNIPLGIISAVSRRARAPVFLYGMVSGALPDFWWALILIFVFFGFLGVVPAPVGRLDLGLNPPPTLTGLYTVDSLLSGNLGAFASAASHLLLPAVTLAFVYGGQLLKMTRTKFMEVLDSDYIRYARAMGLKPMTVYRYALRNALLPVVTLAGLTYGYLISGAVLVETVFSWGGIGQFSVQSVQSSDYFALSGTVLVMAAFALTIYMVVDILYAIIDPRVRLR